MESFKTKCKLIALKTELLLRIIFLWCCKVINYIYLNFLKFVKDVFTYE